MPAILLGRDAAPGTPAYDAESMRTPILLFVGITGGIALATTLLRLYVRQFMLRFTGADDITMGLAMLCGIISFACFCGMSSWGLGRHASVITLDDMSHMAHWSFYYNMFILAGLCLAKISICLLLIRLVKHRSYVWFLWALLTFLAVYHLACEFAIVLSCIPIQAQWDPALRVGAKCISISTFVVLGAVNSGINIFTDVLLAVLPIPVIMSLQLTRRTRIALSFIMLLGFIAVGAGAVKLKAQLLYLGDKDRYYRARYPSWASIELYFGIIAASLPTLKPLAAKVLSATTRSKDGSNGTRSRAQSAAGQQRRSIRNQDELLSKSHIKSSTFYSECSTAIATPEPAVSKDFGQYFSFLRPSRQDSQSAPRSGNGSRNNSIAMDALVAKRQDSVSGGVPGDREEISPAPSLSSESVNGVGSRLEIVRTRQVVTTVSERAPSSMSGKPTGKRRSLSTGGPMGRSASISPSEGPLEEEEIGPCDDVQPLHIRKVSSPNCGVALKRAMESEEELPRVGSTDGLVRGRSWYVG